jgi:hypothetical protein
MTGTHTHLYCLNCKAVTQHDDAGDFQWSCVGCQRLIHAPDGAHLQEVFSEVKIALMIACELPIARRYERCRLQQLNDPDGIIAVWNDIMQPVVYVNRLRAELLPDRVLHTLFTNALIDMVNTRP